MNLNDSDRITGVSKVVELDIDKKDDEIAAVDAEPDFASVEETGLTGAADEVALEVENSEIREENDSDADVGTDNE